MTFYTPLSFDSFNSFMLLVLVRHNARIFHCVPTLKLTLWGEMWTDCATDFLSNPPKLRGVGVQRLNCLRATKLNYLIMCFCLLVMRQTGKLPGKGGRVERVAFKGIYNSIIISVNYFTPAFVLTERRALDFPHGGSTVLSTHGHGEVMSSIMVGGAFSHLWSL